jgi:hypothetical protein
MNNRIPRKFYSITGEMLIDTSESKPGDEIHIYKNDFGYLGYNTRTNRHFYMFVSMIRNADVFRVIEITQ